LPISISPTGPISTPTRSVTSTEPGDSLRAELVEQIAGAQGELESNIEVLRQAAVAGGDAGALGQAEAQLHALTRLQHKISRADPATLAAIRAEVVASVAASVALTQTARTSAASAQTAEVALHAAQTEARRAVTDFTHDFYERKIFDPYLEFSSEEEKRAYREREEQRRREIEKAHAEGTPDGDLRAANLAIAQLEDAGAHGADQSPDYNTGLAGLKTARDSLAARIGEQMTPTKATAAIAKGQSAPAENSLELDPELLASLRATGVTVADTTTQGHGVAKGQASPAQAAIRV